MISVLIVAAAASFSFTASPRAEPMPQTTQPDLAQQAQADECSPRRSCGQISSCEEANWYLQNCSWGSRLDRDSDGLPCESGPC